MIPEIHPISNGCMVPVGRLAFKPPMMRSIITPKGIRKTLPLVKLTRRAEGSPPYPKFCIEKSHL